MSDDNRSNEARFRTIFVSEPECVKLIDANFSLIDMNPAGLRMIGADSIAVIRGRNILDLIDPAYHCAFRNCVAAVFRGETTRIKFEVIGLHGNRLWMDQSAAPIFDPNDPTRVVEMVAVTRDITAPRQAEAELLKVKLAEEILRSKSDFVASISHQLKTPLNQIIGYAELLQEVALEQGRQDDAADHQRILDAAGWLSTMINQMLGVALADVRRHALCDDACDVNELIDDAIKAAQPSAVADVKFVVEHYDEQGVWRCDGQKLDQCLRSLLSSAASACERGAIVVRADCETDAGRKWLRLEVANADAEPGQNADAVSPRVIDETGFGLTLTGQLARLMGGDLSIASTPDHGLRAILRVPVADTGIGAMAAATR